MTHASPHLLLLGVPDAAEMAPVLRAVRANVPASCVWHALDLAAVRSLLEAESWFPDLVVVFQSWPDEFSASDVHALLQLFPLARIVCCFGAWCDSDGRTRTIWPLAVRVPVSAASRRIEHELALLADHEGSTTTASGFPLPLTASRREIFEFDYARRVQANPDLRSALNSASGDTQEQPVPATRHAAPAARHAPAVPRIAVVSPDTSWKQMIESALNSCGCACSELSDEPCLHAVLWDAAPWTAHQSQRLQAFRRRNRQTDVMAFVGFPRDELVCEVRAAGADHVYSKLTPLLEWLETLLVCTAMPSPPREIRPSN